jgi:hypothetical protein
MDAVVHACFSERKMFPSLSTCRQNRKPPLGSAENIQVMKLKTCQTNNLKWAASNPRPHQSVHSARPAPSADVVYLLTSLAAHFSFPQKWKCRQTRIWNLGGGRGFWDPQPDSSPSRPPTLNSEYATAGAGRSSCSKGVQDWREYLISRPTTRRSGRGSNYTWIAI